MPKPPEYVAQFWDRCSLFTELVIPAWPVHADQKSRTRPVRAKFPHRIRGRIADGPHDRAQIRAALRSGPPECSSPASPLMTVAEAAAFLSVSTKTVRRLIARGALDCVKIGRSIRLGREVIERYISDCSNG